MTTSFRDILIANGTIKIGPSTPAGATRLGWVDKPCLRIDPAGVARALLHEKRWRDNGCKPLPGPLPWSPEYEKRPAGAK